jgi:beta-glucosidase
VNLTDHERQWHNEFSYFGANVYAYVLHKYGHWVDFVSVQFYESYSKAAQAVYHNKIAPSVYLQRYVESLSANHETFYVDFSQDPSVGMEGQNVSLPLSKLVLGLANGWGGQTSDYKAIYISPVEAGIAWKALGKQIPRGFMFWTIDLEGMNDIYLAHDLNKILDENS